MLSKQFPKWKFKNKTGLLYAFRNLRCIEGFQVAVRVGVDGVMIFGKNGFSPNLFYLNPKVTASLEDFAGKKGEGFKPFEVGCVRSGGNHWFSDCIYEPGLIDEDYEELKSILMAIYTDYQNNHLPTQKQIDRIQKMKEVRGEEFIKDYYYSYYPSGDFKHLTRKSAQKIITGLQWIEPRKPINNVYESQEWIS